MIESGVVTVRLAESIFRNMSYSGEWGLRRQDLHDNGRSSIRRCINVKVRLIPEISQREPHRGGSSPTMSEFNDQNYALKQGS